MDRKRMVSSLVEYYTNGNKSQFAKMLGITPQTINTWISRNTFNAELIYAKCEGVSANWLLTGCGSMINEQEREVNASLQVQEKFPLKTDNLVDLQRIPLYNLEATAGLVSLFNDVDAIPISYISLPDLPACDGAVYVRGDSMYPLLKSGDIVLYKQVHDMQYGIFWGEMYLISANVDGDEFVTIKYIHKSERENCVKLVSHNQHHEPKDIPISMICALALVKASVRYNTIR